MPAQKIMIIRHAEKPEHHGPRGVDENGDEDKKSLTVRGWQRAGALVQFFAPSGHATPLAPLARPKHLFAAFADPATDDDSKRPRETIEPLSAFLPTEIDDTCGKDEIEKLVSKATAADGVVLISWEHKRIPPIAQILVSGAQSIPEWPDDRFDMVWVFDRAGAAWHLTQVPQLLLAGDRSDLFD